MGELRESARATAVSEFDTLTVTLPKWESMLLNLAAGKLPAFEPPAPGPQHAQRIVEA